MPKGNTHSHSHQPASIHAEYSSTRLLQSSQTNIRALSLYRQVQAGPCAPPPAPMDSQRCAWQAKH
eukprot:9707690-Heterocapsa_arctica.AAC.1